MKYAIFTLILCTAATPVLAFDNPDGSFGSFGLQPFYAYGWVNEQTEEAGRLTVTLDESDGFYINNTTYGARVIVPLHARLTLFGSYSENRYEGGYPVPAFDAEGNMYVIKTVTTRDEYKVFISATVYIGGE